METLKSKLTANIEIEGNLDYALELKMIHLPLETNDPLFT